MFYFLVLVLSLYLIEIEMEITPLNSTRRLPDRLGRARCSFNKLDIFTCGPGWVVGLCRIKFGSFLIFFKLENCQLID